MIVKRVSFLFVLLIFLFTHSAEAKLVNPAQTAQQLLMTRSEINQDRGEMREASRAAIKAKMEEFKQRIAQIRDERKKAIVEKINSKIQNANTRLTNKMTEALSKLAQILNGIREKAEALKAAGEDTAALDNAIAAAETAIIDAHAAVNAQVGKVYSANIITDEANLKNTIGRMVSQFRLDVQSVHKKVIEAKQAVQKAISELAKLGGVGNLRATNSGTLTP